MKMTKQEIEKEVLDYRRYAIQTAKAQYPKEKNETDEEYAERLELIVDLMCEQFQSKIEMAYGIQIREGTSLANL